MHSINELITLKLFNKKIKLFYSEDGTLTIIANDTTFILDIKLSNASNCEKVLAFLRDKYILGYNVAELYQKFISMDFYDLPIIDDLKHIVGLLYRKECSNLFEILDICLPEPNDIDFSLRLPKNEKSYFIKHINEAGEKVYEEIVKSDMQRLLSTIESPYLQVSSLITSNKHRFDVEKAKSIKVHLDNVLSNTTDLSKIREIEYVVNSYLNPYIDYAEQNNGLLKVKDNLIGLETGEISYYPENPLELSEISSDYGIQSCFRSMDDEHSIVRIKLSNLIVQVMSTFLWSNELDSFCSIEDFYKDVAKLAGQHSSKTVSSYRDVAYAIIHYLVYGFADSFSVYDLGISKMEFKKYSQQFANKYPTTASGIRNYYEFIDSMKFAVSLTEKYIPKWSFEQEVYSSNSPFILDTTTGSLINKVIIATSWDLIKFKSCKVNELLLPVPECKIMWTNTDEIAIQMQDALIDDYLPQIEKIMKTDLPDWLEFEFDFNFEMQTTVTKTLSNKGE